MKRLLIAPLLVVACGRPAAGPAAEATTTTTAAAATNTTAGDKSAAEKAFDAGMRGKQKAEQINTGQAGRAAEADAAGN